MKVDKRCFTEKSTFNVKQDNNFLTEDKKRLKFLRD